MESAFRVLTFKEMKKEGGKEKGREEVLSLLITVNTIRVKYYRMTKYYNFNLSITVLQCSVEFLCFFHHYKQQQKDQLNDNES